MKKGLCLLSCLFLAISAWSQKTSRTHHRYRIYLTPPPHRVRVIQFPTDDQKDVLIQLDDLRYLERGNDTAAIVVYSGHMVTWRGNGKEEFKMLKFVEANCGNGSPNGLSDPDPFDFDYDHDTFDSKDKSAKVTGASGKCFKHLILEKKPGKAIDPHVIIEPSTIKLTPLEQSKGENSNKASKPEGYGPSAR